MLDIQPLTFINNNNNLHILDQSVLQFIYEPNGMNNAMVTMNVHTKIIDNSHILKSLFHITEYKAK
jgi:hypothetical protein